MTSLWVNNCVVSWVKYFNFKAMFDMNGYLGNQIGPICKIAASVNVSHRRRLLQGVTYLVHTTLQGRGQEEVERTLEGS